MRDREGGGGASAPTALLPSLMRIQAVEFSRAPLPHSDNYRQQLLLIYHFWGYFYPTRARLRPVGWCGVGGGGDGRGGGSKSALCRSRASVSRLHFGRSRAARGHV